MKLSEAIREGSKNRRQLRMMYASKFGNVCALGAAYAGARGEAPVPRKDANTTAELHVLFPQLKTVMGHLAESAHPNWTLHDVIVHLNDYKGMTFGEIVEWLEKHDL